MRFKRKFPEASSSWDQGVPLGNGKTGCLIWGPSKGIRFSLDRTDIWDRTRLEQTAVPEFTYRNLVRLAKEKNTTEIRCIFDAPYQEPAPTKLPSGTLILHFPESSSVEYGLDLKQAQAELNVKGKEQTICIQAVCHAENETGMIRVGAVPPLFSLELEHPAFGTQEEKNTRKYDPDHREISQGSLKNLHYPCPVQEERIASDGIRILRYVQPVTDRFSYGVTAAVREEAGETLIFYQISSSDDGENWIEEAEALLCSQIKAGYEAYQASHRNWWKNFWKKSSVHLPEKLAEEQWYMTNYLFASCSRKGCFPMPLQGVWTADDGCLPPWKGDYHNDLNTQLSYTHFFKAGHWEEGEAFLDFLWELRPAAREFAKKFYGTEGICLPGVMTIDGQPLGGWPMYSLSPTQQIWLCQSFDLYYRYTGDRNVLIKRAWPYMRETAVCITSLLEEGEDGKYRLLVSSSPEIHDDETESWVTPNSNYDLALLRYLYQTLTEYARELGEEKELERWQNILKKLPDLAVDDRGVLMLSPDEILTESHRHLSNALAICPLHLIGYDKQEDRRIVDAVVSDYEFLGTGMWVGFSFAWMSHLYGIQGNGEGAWDRLRIFWESFCSSNGFHLNGDYKKRGYSTFHYRPFTLEANMYAADALQEMLLQTEKGRVILFPAVPEEWKQKGLSFQGFQGFGGLCVSARMKEGKVISITLTSAIDQDVTVQGIFGAARPEKPEKSGSEEWTLETDRLQVRLKAGKTWNWQAGVQKENDARKG